MGDVPEMVTIGVYGFDGEAFLQRLRRADVRRLFDLRRRDPRPRRPPPIVSALPGSGCAALLWVERDPGACHRSLIAQRLTERHGVTIEHLRPW